MMEERPMKKTSKFAYSMAAVAVTLCAAAVVREALARGAGQTLAVPGQLSFDLAAMPAHT